jgi:hypothetical protein
MDEREKILPHGSFNQLGCRGPRDRFFVFMMAGER